MSNSTTSPNVAAGERTERLPLLTAVLVAAVIGVALFVAGYWVGSARAGSERGAETQVTEVPDWFLPVWDAYDRSSKVTPEFDFASLYESRPRRLARVAEAAFADASRVRRIRAAPRVVESE